MFLIGHAALGAAIVKAAGIENPIAAFAVGWASHYLADFFPHGDEDLGAWTKRGHEVLRLLFVVGIDGALLLAAYAFFLSQRPFSLPMFAAMVGSAVPDVMWGLEKLLHRKLFGLHEEFHGRNHNFFRLRVPYQLALIAQLIATLVLWRWLIG